VGGEREDGFDASARGTFYEGCGDDCEIAGFEASFAERAAIGNAHAELFYQSRRARAEPFAPGDAGAREEIIVGEDSEGGWKVARRFWPHRCKTKPAP
jgi:hypothetical protein